MAGKALGRELMISADGSHTIKVPELKEHYHSHKGAIQESEHVFIRMGLHCVPASEVVSVLEIGFGTGLNALLSLHNAQKRRLTYVGLEPFPLHSELISKLNYPERIGGEELRSSFEAMHAARFEESCEITEHFVLEKRQIALQEFDTEQRFDLVYYDAFAPHAQPELWEPSIWAHLRALMNPNALLVTYCAKGQVRRDMQAAGFIVERLPGPPGKREMLRAKNPEK